MTPLRLVFACLLLAALSACVDESAAENNPARVVCSYAGEVIFDQWFDSARLTEGSRIVAQRGDTLAMVEPPQDGVCEIVQESQGESQP